MPTFSAGVAPPSGVLQSSGYQYQYPLPHGGGGGHQLTFTPPQLVQQGMTFYGHYPILLSDEAPCERLEYHQRAHLFSYFICGSFRP